MDLYDQLSYDIDTMNGPAHSDNVPPATQRLRRPLLRIYELCEHLFLPSSLRARIYAQSPGVAGTNPNVTRCSLSSSKDSMCLFSECMGHGPAHPGDTMCDTYGSHSSTYNARKSTYGCFSFMSREEIQAYIASSTPSPRRTFTWLHHDLMPQVKRALDFSVVHSLARTKKVWPVIGGLTLLIHNVLIHATPMQSSCEKQPACILWNLTMHLQDIQTSTILTWTLVYITTKTIPPPERFIRFLAENPTAASHVGVWLKVSVYSYLFMTLPMTKRHLDLGCSSKDGSQSWLWLPATVITFIMFKLVIFDGGLIYLHYLYWRPATEGHQWPGLKPSSTKDNKTIMMSLTKDVTSTPTDIGLPERLRAKSDPYNSDDDLPGLVEAQTGSDSDDSDDADSDFDESEELETALDSGDDWDSDEELR